MTALKYSILALAATVFGLVLLGFQVVGGLEYTVGASAYTRASMVVAMVTVALLPIFIEAARRLSWWMPIPLLIAFVAFLGYSLPASIGRIGEVKEAKASGAALSQEHLARVRVDYTKAERLVDEATRWQATECASGVGPKCRSVEYILAQRSSHLRELSRQLQEVKPELGDLGSETVAWALQHWGVSADVIRKASGLLLAGGLEIAIWALMWLGSAAAARAFRSVGHAERAPSATAAEPRLAPTEAQLEDLIVRTVRQRFGGIAPSQEAIVEAIGSSKANVSRKVDALVEAGHLAKVREGRCNVIKLVA
jgi:hypothetical protein